jgi:alpha-2-macroglobulin-like protein
VEWTIRATDEQGRNGRAQVKWEGRADDDFLFRTDKAVYAGGETMRLTVLSAGSEPVLVDVHKDGQTLLTAAIPLANGTGEFALDLPPELSGTMQLSAYRLGPNGSKGIKTRLVYVRPASQVRITTIMDRAEYQPGRQAKLRFQLADALGKPIAGALSLSAVDEAVFAVLQQSAGTEQSFYTVSPELLQPALHLASWSPPTPDKEEERRTFDQALFALSANAPRPAADREAIIQALLPFVDNNRRIFDVLDDPIFEKLVQDGSVPEHVLAVLRNPGGPTGFFATTYPENVRSYKATEASVAGFIKVIWVLIGISLGVLALALLLHYLSKARNGCLIAAILMLSMITFVSCTGMRGDMAERFALLPVQRVREASEKTQMRNNVKQLELAIEGFKDANKKMPGIVEGVGDNNAGPRVRQWFPETLLWRPELITDEHGQANLEIPLADSITTWRLTASAVALDGRLGASQTQIKVFQPFFVDINLPIALTLGDEVSVPVVVYNYLDQPQDVKLDFSAAAWYESQEPGSRRLELKPGEVRSTHFRLRASKVGTHELQVTAAGSGLADAVKRRIEVLPGGRRIETVWNGNLSKETDFSITLPEGAIPGSGKLFFKIYPSQFSQVVEGLDSIFRLPSGCFEQTSSTTYPNVLALDYLQRTKKTSRAVEEKARKYINLGYQRLVGFEVAGGGFEWFGRPPANQALTAYGLMEFTDMARVHDVDPRLIERTRAWLMKKRQSDGSWTPEAHVPAGAPGQLGGDELARLSTTAYIAWAVFRTQMPATDVNPTHHFLLRHQPRDIHDPHVLALVGNALLRIDPSGSDAAPYLDRLESLQRSTADGKQVWWEQPLNGRTTFHGSGRSGSIETTALASLAFLQSGKHLASARAALVWIAQQRDSAGTWHSTQATVLALKAMLAATNSLTEDRERRIEWTCNLGKKETLLIPADQSDVMKQIDLTSHLRPGKQTLTLAEPTGNAANFQVTFRYHLPSSKEASEATLALGVKYDREKLRVGETVTATATAVNRTKEPAPMVLVELPIPAGFSMDADSFAKLIKEGRIAKYEIQPTAVLVYLRELPAGGSLQWAYGLRAEMPAQVAVPAARAYEYYNPDREGRSTEARLIVVE